MLHVGKTGGTALKAALSPIAEEAGIVLHKHATRLADIPFDEPVFWFIRDPITRFVSSFNSRLRRGQPRRNARWNEDEALAFSKFPTANSLALAIGTPDGDHAMRSIRHVNQHLGYWFDSIEQIDNRREIFIGLQTPYTFAADFERLKVSFGLPDVQLPADPVASHETPPEFDRKLNSHAMLALKDWYAADFTFYRRMLWRRGYNNRYRDNPAN